jgi:hypothetical protein
MKSYQDRVEVVLPTDDTSIAIAIAEVVAPGVDVHDGAALTRAEQQRPAETVAR